MAQNRYNFESPGASASDAIQEFLLKQIALKRQQLIDDTNRKVSEQNIAASKESTASLTAQRTAAEETRRQQMAVGVAGTMVPGQDLPEDTQKTLREGNLGHLINQTTTQGPEIGNESVMGGVPTYATATTQTFRGTPDQIEKQKRDAEITQFINEPDVPEQYKPLQAYLKAQRISGDKTLPKELFLNQQEPLYRTNSHTGKVERMTDTGAWATVTGTVPKDAKFVTFAEPTSNTFNINTTNEAGVDMLAIRLATSGDTSGLGRGGLQSEFGQAVMKRAAQYNKATGQFVTGTNPNAPDLTSAKAGYSADSKALAAVQLNMDTVEAYTRTAKYNADKLDTIMKEVPDTGIPWFNTPYRALSTNLGASRAMAKLNAIRQSVQNEYARINSQSNLSGVLSDSARKEFEVILSDNSTPEMIHEALAVLQMEGGNRLKGFREQRDEVKGRIGTGTPITGAAGNYNPATGRVE